MPPSTEKIEKYRRDILKIIWQAIDAVNPENAIYKHFRLLYENLHIDDRVINISDFKRIHIIGAGKASTQMAKTVENILLRRLSGGLVCTKVGHATPLHNIAVMEAGHPLPDENSVLAAQRALQLAHDCDKDDLIVCLLSGGASSLWCAPISPITIRDKIETNDLLLKCGANIQEINAFRKHISRIKGGYLAQAAAPATVITLAISDVIGDDLSCIGSGPTVADTTNYKQVFEVIEKYHLAKYLPKTVVEYIWNGYKKINKETPKPSDSIFVKNVAAIISSNQQALDTAMDTGRYLGYKTYIYSSKLSGEASIVSMKLVNKLKEMAKSHRPGDQPIMILAGGETTVMLRGKGKGGRNQHLALAAAEALAGFDTSVIASIGTDGTDGPTDAAGAFADCTTLNRAKEKGLEIQTFLNDFNSYKFFDSMGDLIKTGPTGTNVMDIQILIFG